MRADLGAGCVKRPVRPVGVCGSRYRCGLMVARRRREPRIFAGLNGYVDVERGVWVMIVTFAIAEAGSRLVREPRVQKW